MCSKLFETRFINTLETENRDFRFSSCDSNLSEVKWTTLEEMKEQPCRLLVLISYLFSSYLGGATVRCRVRAGIRSTIGAADDLVRSSSTTGSSSALPLLFTLRQGLRRRNLYFLTTMCRLNNDPPFRLVLFPRFLLPSDPPILPQETTHRPALAFNSSRIHRLLNFFTCLIQGGRRVAGEVGGMRLKRLIDMRIETRYRLRYRVSGVIDLPERYTW